MAKHLPPRGSALSPCRAALLPALMWLILLTIFPARLHGEVKVNEPSIVVPTNTPIRLSSLIENGIVEGVEGNDSVYTITASPMTGVNVYDVYGYIRFLSPVTSTITYTNKENPEDSFSVEMTSKYYPGQYIQRYLGTVYIGESKTLTLPDDYFPLSDLTIEHQIIPGYPEGDIECETNGNDMTITGVAEGWVNMLFISKFGTTSWQITVAPKPSVDNIEVKEKSIVVPTRTSITLSSLIQNGIVEGVTGKSEDYSVASSETSGVNVTNHDDYLQSVNVMFTAPVTSTITFTHKDYPDVSFSIEMTAKNNPADYLSRNLGTVYVGESKTLTIPDDYMPLSYFTIQRSMLEPNADFKFEVNGNDITITGVAAGRANLRFTNNYGTSTCTINIQSRETPDFKVLRNEMVVLVDATIYVDKLVSDKIVEGLPGDRRNYNITSSAPEMVSCDSNSGSFRFTSLGTATISFTHKSLPEISFSLEVTAKKNTRLYLSQKLAYPTYPYVGESKVIVIPDEYVPVSDYIISQSYYGYDDGLDPFFEISEGGKKIIFKFETTGWKNLYVKYHLGNGGYNSSNFGLTIKTREVAVEVSEDGEATAGSQIGVPVTISLPEDIDLSVEEGEKIVWESADDEIASVDPVTGEITPLKLGKTTVTVKKKPETHTAALTSRAGGEEETLVSIEFWVTNLEIAEEMTLTAGSQEQLIYNIDAGKDKYPTDIDIKPEWFSSDPEVATVSAEGKVTALSEGTTVITLMTNIGTKQTIITVEPGSTPAEPLSINPSDVALTVGSRLSLSTRGDGGKKVIWRTSDSFVAQIDENGVITAIAPGTAIITATIEGTSTQATIRATVFERTTGIEETEASEPVVKAENLSISVSGIDSDLPVEIYNVSGRLIASRKGSCSVAVGQTGIYIVRIGGIVRKVAVTR